MRAFGIEPKSDFLPKYHLYNNFAVCDTHPIHVCNCHQTLSYLAEGVGFEPTVHLCTLVF